MKKKAILRTILVVVAITGMLLVVRSRAAAPAREDAGRESLDACSRQESDGKMPWESLSGQFFSSF